MILADPKGSVLAPMVATGKLIEAGSWLVEGIGEDFVPPNCDLSLVTEAFTRHRRRELRHRARAAAQGGDPGRLLLRHAARRRAEILPCAERAEARRDLRVRQRQQVPLQDVQRLLDAGPGPAGARTPGRPARPDRAPACRPGDDHGLAQGHPARRLPAHEALRDLPASGPGRRQGRGHHRRIRPAPRGLWPCRQVPRARVRRHDDPPRIHRGEPAARRPAVRCWSAITSPW